MNFKGATKNSFYALSEPEKKMAKYLASQRYNKNRSTNTFNNKIGPQSNEQTDLEGIAAEIAFCKMFNVYPDFQLDTRPYYDAILPNGITVDVKATSHPHGRLLAVLNKASNPPQLYALMIGEFDTGYTFKGFYPSKKLLQECNIKNLGYGPTYAIDQKFLKDLHGN